MLTRQQLRASVLECGREPKRATALGSFYAFNPAESGAKADFSHHERLGDRRGYFSLRSAENTSPLGFSGSVNFHSSIFAFNAFTTSAS
jgi:hypothetical protein